MEIKVGDRFVNTRHGEIYGIFEVGDITHVHVQIRWISSYYGRKQIQVELMTLLNIKLYIKEGVLIPLEIYNSPVYQAVRGLSNGN
jgi:hypothetical protein